MNKNTTITLVIIIGLVLLGVFAYSAWWSDDTSDNASMNQETDLQDEFNPNETSATIFTTYSNPRFDFTFDYPSEASTAVEAGRVKVTFLGPNNTQGSEVTDGFTFYVRTEEISSGSAVSDLVDILYEEEVSTLEVIKELDQRSYGGRTVYEFSVESELGSEVNYVIFEADEDTAFVVSYAVDGPSGRNYVQIINEMIDSLQLSSDNTSMFPVPNRTEDSLLLLS